MYKDGIKVICPRQITGCPRESTWRTPNWKQTSKTSTVKYVVIAMKADNHNESGIFALFSLVRKVAPWLILPAMISGAALLANNSSSKFRSRKPRKWMSISSRTTLATATKPVGT